MSKGDDPFPRPTALGRLVTIGQAKGFLTYDEVNDGMPASIESREQIDAWLSVLTREGIEIVDKPHPHRVTP